ncbi:hypothetical protein [Parapedobacter tibetensis]|uniref:hypothetical protein n=1 Tax=Parapedobacter tibetensis TaxID=2972951 RepID=UPI00214D71CE|nr:hypothetical protein [Parapedobacter tibetensis]
MKTLFASYILGIVLLMQGCQCDGIKDPNDDMKPIENKFDSPEEALRQAQENLHLIINENQRQVFGLSSDEEIKQLSTQAAVPITYLSIDQLKDTARISSDDAYWYGLGSEKTTKIGISVERADDSWIQSTIGMKKFVQAINRHPSATRLVEVPGLEMSFMELQDPDRPSYIPIVDYPEAKLSIDGRYSWVELIRILDNYREQLEIEFGEDFINGYLER